MKLTWEKIELAYAGKTYSPKHITKEFIKSRFLEDESWSGVPYE